MLAAFYLLLAWGIPPASGAQGKETLAAGPTIDRDRVNRESPILPRAPEAGAPPQAPVVEQQAAPGVLARLRFEGTSLPRAALDAATAPFVGRALDTAFGGYRTRVVRASATWSATGKKGGYPLAGGNGQPGPRCTRRAAVR